MELGPSGPLAPENEDADHLSSDFLSTEGATLHRKRKLDLAQQQPKGFSSGAPPPPLLSHQGKEPKRPDPPVTIGEVIEFLRQNIAMEIDLLERATVSFEHPRLKEFTVIFKRLQAAVQQFLAEGDQPHTSNAASPEPEPEPEPVQATNPPPRSPSPQHIVDIALAAVRAAAKWRPRAPNPPQPLKGDSTDAYYLWRFAILRKMDEDRPMFVTQHSCMRYALTQMEEPILSALRWNVAGDPDGTLVGLLEEIERHLGIHPVADATTRHLALAVQRQGETVTAYYHRLLNLFDTAGTPEPHRVRKYLTTLDPAIATSLHGNQYTRVRDVLNDARRVEAGRAKTFSHDPPSRPAQAVQKPAPAAKPPAPPAPSVPANPNTNFGAVAVNGSQLPRVRDVINDTQQVEVGCAETFSHHSPSRPAQAVQKLAPAAKPPTPPPPSYPPPSFPAPSFPANPNAKFGAVAVKPQGWAGTWFASQNKARWPTARERFTLARQFRCYGCRGSGHRSGDSCCPKKARRGRDVDEVISHKGYELARPEHREAAGSCPVFDPWKPDPPSQDPYPRQGEEPIVALDPSDDPHDELRIRKIVDCRLTPNGLKYKALFDGPWDKWNADPLWRKWSDFKNAPSVVIAYHNQHPEKPPLPDFFARWAAAAGSELPRGEQMPTGQARQPAGLPASNGHLPQPVELTPQLTDQASRHQRRRAPSHVAPADPEQPLRHPTGRPSQPLGQSAASNRHLSQPVGLAASSTALTRQPRPVCPVPQPTARVSRRRRNESPSETALDDPEELLRRRPRPRLGPERQPPSITVVLGDSESEPIVVLSDSESEPIG
ncbi:hypothetical protein BP00DRAFT_444685 [Aspergillus indologenus CBS 114.80]|uniref:Retrotransposon gag domain-containing protein n=1 Tax=Aspergillus indologenus CBS 114.80 TaxID=1450541 RepID=A0A2V5I9R0_9EURO|nr:hypothetical protein BP00DRAFT_444685 [Aspergillus indologenus CBS 114.80]